MAGLLLLLRFAATAAVVTDIVAAVAAVPAFAAVVVADIAAAVVAVALRLDRAVGSCGAGVGILLCRVAVRRSELASRGQTLPSIPCSLYSFN